MSHDQGQEPDGNGILYSSLYFLILKNWGELNAQDLVHVHDIYTKCKVLPGLIDRGKDNLSEEEQDDYYGLACASQITDPIIALDIYSYGKNHLWYFDNMQTARGWAKIKLWFDLWFGRFPGFCAHIKFCAHEDPSLFDKCWWAFGMICGALGSKANTSGRQLEWCMYCAYSSQFHDSFICSLAARFWKNRLWAKFPNGMGDVFAGYFYTTHPFAVWMKGRI